jgi:hypothetical protein
MAHCASERAGSTRSEPDSVCSATLLTPSGRAPNDEGVSGALCAGALRVGGEAPSARGTLLSPEATPGSACAACIVL